MAPASYAVDVSGNQPAHQNWRAFGVHMGIAKATEGQHTRDPWFARHIADITAAGLVPGGYHFAWPDQPAAAEAANYLGAVEPFASAGPFIHALDLERNPSGANWTGTVAQKRAYAEAWIAAVKKAHPGQRVVTYLAGDSIAAGMVPSGTDGIWYPAYPVQGRSFGQLAAATRPKPSGRTVWGWQGTSVPRDQTVIYMTPEQLKTWAAGKAPAPEKEEDVTAADVWAEQIATSPDKGAPTASASVLLRGTHADVAYLNSLVHQLIAQQAAAAATITTLVDRIGSGDSVDTIVAAVREASEAGATAALKDATVNVHVDVTQPAAPAAS